MSGSLFLRCDNFFLFYKSYVSPFLISVNRYLFCHFHHVHTVPFIGKTLRYEENYPLLRHLCSIYPIFCYHDSWLCGCGDSPSKKTISQKSAALLSLCLCVCVQNLGTDPSQDKVRMIYNTQLIGFLVVGCCDFIAQSILVRTADPYYLSSTFYWPKKKKKIYRCWIVWGHNTRVVILPIILVVAFLGPSNLSIIIYTS